MNVRLACWALSLIASGVALAGPEDDRLAAERAAVNARLAAQERECASRFIVADCVETARKSHRDAIKSLRDQEIRLDEGRRQAAAEARRKTIAEKAQAQQARASDMAPEPPRVRVRRAPQSPEAAASGPAVVAPAARSAEPSTAAERRAVEQQNIEAFEQRQREAKARRAAVARRNAEREARGKVASPLPVPAGASAPR